MSAYQRFLPRDGTRTTARVIAEAAEAAEVKATQGSPAAQALLNLAEVRPGDRQLQQASAEVQRQRRAGIPGLQQLQQLQQGPAPRIDQRLIEGAGSHPVPDDGAGQLRIPTEWSNGVASLATIAPPRTYPAHAWQQLISDAERFLEEWAQQAAALGWPAWELFGCHRRAPWARIDGMGLVLLLHGDPLAALTATEAVIRRASGAHQTWHRRQRDPLTTAERCLVWELA